MSGPQVQRPSRAGVGPAGAPGLRAQVAPLKKLIHPPSATPQHPPGATPAALVASSLAPRPPLDLSEPQPEASTSGRGQSIACHLAEELSISQDRAAWMISNWPGLLETPVQAVKTGMLAAAQVLGCSMQQAAEALVKEHRLAGQTSDSLESRLRLLAEALTVSTTTLKPAARKAPRVLFDEPAAVRTRLQEVANMLHSSPSTVTRAALEEHWLLCAEPPRISAQLHHLAKVMKQPLTAVQAAVLKEPRLLHISHDTLQSKMQHIGSTLQLKPRSVQQLVWAQPRLLRLSTQQVQARVAELTRVIPHHQLQAMVFEEPSLLWRSPSLVIRNLRVVQQLLSCGTEAALELVQRRPAVLTRSAKSLSASYKALSVWEFDGEEKRQLLHEHPLLLRLSPRELHLRCRWLRALMMSSALMHSMVRELSPQLLGVLLLHLPHAWSRLQYMVESSCQALDIISAVQADPAKFEALCPGYSKWLAWRIGGSTAVPPPWRQPAKSRAAQRQKWGRPVSRQSSSSSSSQSSSGSGHSWSQAGSNSRDTARHRSPLLRQPSISQQQQQLSQVLPSVSQRLLPSQVQQQGGLEPGEGHGHSQRHMPGPQQLDGSGDNINSSQQQQQERQHMVEVVHEARTVLLGVHFVHKPRRAVMQPSQLHQQSSDAASCPGSEAGSTSGSEAGGRSGTTGSSDTTGSVTPQLEAEAVPSTADLPHGNGSGVTQAQAAVAPSVYVPTQS